MDRTAWVQVPLRELTLNAPAFGCGWASVALGLALGRLALGRLALGRLALGLALAAQLLQPRASLCGLPHWGAEAGRWWCRVQTLAMVQELERVTTLARALAQVRLATPTRPPF